MSLFERNPAYLSCANNKGLYQPMSTRLFFAAMIFSVYMYLANAMSSWCLRRVVCPLHGHDRKKTLVYF